MSVESLNLVAITKTYYFPFQNHLVQNSIGVGALMTIVYDAGRPAPYATIRIQRPAPGMTMGHGNRDGYGVPNAMLQSGS